MPGSVRPGIGVLAVLIILGCSDGSTRPRGVVWEEMALPAESDPAGLIGVAFFGGRGLAVGAVQSAGTPRPQILELRDGAWERLEVAGLPSTSFLVDVGFSRTGRAVLVGAAAFPELRPFLLEERGEEWSAISFPVDGYLNRVVAAEGDTLWAAGLTHDGTVFLSTEAGSWEAVDAGFPTDPQEKAFTDLSFRDGVLYGCGFDDGGAPYHVVHRHTGAGWEQIATPDAFDYRAILADEAGVLWLGGVDGDRARLFRQVPGSPWEEMELPEAARLGSVNDVVQSTEGRMFLACGGGELPEAHILSFDGAAWTAEGPGFTGRIASLAEGPGGVLHAAGVKGDDGGPEATEMVLLARRP